MPAAAPAAAAAPGEGAAPSRSPRREEEVCLQGDTRAWGQRSNGEAGQPLTCPGCPRLKTDPEPARRPSLPLRGSARANALLLALEGRAPWEYAALLASMPWLRKLPRGDGHPVLVFPGLGANDFTTAPLRRFLDGLGYVTHPWGQGFNFGPRQGVLEALHARRAAPVQRATPAGQPDRLEPGRPLCARARQELPDHVRSVITLGTPFTGHPRATNAWRFFELVSGQSVHDPHGAGAAAPRAAGADDLDLVAQRGVVAWRCSVVAPGPQAENIELHASHVGMGMNRWRCTRWPTGWPSPPATGSPSSRTARGVGSSGTPHAEAKQTT